MALLESFPSFWHLAIRGSLWLVLLCCLPPSGAYRAPHLGSLSVAYFIRDLKITLAGVLLCCFAHHVLIGPPSLGCFSCLVLCSEREAAEITLLSVCDSAISPFLPVSWLSFISIFHCNVLHQVPSHRLPSVNSRPCPGIVFQSLCSSSKLQHFLEDLYPCLGYVWLWQGLSVWFSFCSDSHRSAASLSNSLNASPLLQIFALPCISVPDSVPQPKVQIQFYSLSSFWPSFVFPAECCLILYILFQWSGSQLVFCKIFCVWRCIPDISVESDVLHVHQLFHHHGSHCMILNPHLITSQVCCGWMSNFCSWVR